MRQDLSASKNFKVHLIEQFLNRILQEVFLLLSNMWCVYVYLSVKLTIDICTRYVIA